MVELGLKGELFGANVVFTWGNEGDSLQSIGDSLEVKSSSIENGEYELISSVEEDKGCRIVLDIGWSIEVQSSSSRTTARESDGMLQVGRLANGGLRSWGSENSSIDLAASCAEGLAVAFFS